MLYNFAYMWSLKNKTDGRTSRVRLTDAQTHRHGEQTAGGQGREGLGDGVNRLEGLGSINWWLQNSHRDVKYSGRNIANDIVLTIGVPSGRWKYGGNAL